MFPRKFSTVSKTNTFVTSEPQLLQMERARTRVLSLTPLVEKEA